MRLSWVCLLGVFALFSANSIANTVAINIDSGVIASDVYDSSVFRLPESSQVVTIHVKAFAGYGVNTTVGRPVSFQVLYSEDGVNFTAGPAQNQGQTLGSATPYSSALQFNFGTARQWYLKVRYTVGASLPTRTDTLTATTGSVTFSANAHFNTSANVKGSGTLPLPAFSVAGYTPTKTTYSYVLTNTITSLCTASTTSSHCGGTFSLPSDPSVGSYIVWRANTNQINTVKDVAGYSTTFLTASVQSWVNNTLDTNYVDQTMTLSSGKAIVTSQPTSSNELTIVDVNYASGGASTMAPILNLLLGDD